MYGRNAPYVPGEPAVLPVPAAVLPAPAAILPGPAPGGEEPYTLDSGDRLRIVVFGQEG
jgi:protein involved in polysaccharide export with SLBB domain